MFILRFKKIIGIFLLITILFQQVPITHAIYSPRLSEQVGLVKKDIQAARQLHGTGNLNQMADRRNEAVSLNQGLFHLFGNALLNIIIQSFGDSFWDGLSLLILTWLDNNQSITNCLRDDIWEINALQEQILNELFKAALLSDGATSNKLWKDYKDLNKYIDGFEITLEDGTKELVSLKYNYKSNFWFPTGKNLYVFCPYGEFKEAFEELGESFDNLAETFQGKGLTFGSFSSMAAAAEKRAIRRAADYITKNKVSLTLGGEQGASPRSLVNGPGLDGLQADLETELALVRALGKAAFTDTFKGISKFWKAEERVDKMIQAYEKAEEAEEKTINQLETAVQFNLSLHNVSENGLYQVENTMWQINNEIRKSFETDTSAKAVCEKLNEINKKQCKNKSGDLPSCG